MYYYDINIGGDFESGLCLQVAAEVSQVADAAYGENGVSLYDSVVLTEKDHDTVSALLEDGIAQFVRASSDISSYGTHGTGSSAVDAIVVDVPDFDASQADAVTEQISRYLVMLACTAIFNQRRAALVPEYTNRVQAALDNAIELLRKRKTPSRTTT